MKITLYILSICSALLLSSIAQAQTLIEGKYVSPPGENGRGSCTLEVKSMGKSPKYGDEMYGLYSSGEGACEWTGVGLAKNFNVSAGMVSSGGYSGYIHLKWPFGPGGKQVNLSAFNPDGTARYSETFTRE